MKKQQKQIAIALFALTSLVTSGCSSTIANFTGSTQVGVMSGDRTFSQRLRDSGIEKNAMVNLYKLDKRFQTHSRVSVAAFHDAVLLTGQVPDAHLKNLATDNARAIREVSAVHNEIEVGRQANYDEIVNDGLIKASIRKNLLLLSGFKDSRVKVVVERGVVYLMGVLSDDEARIAIQTVQQTGGIKKIVSLIDRLEDVEKRMAQKILASNTDTSQYKNPANKATVKTTVLNKQTQALKNANQQAEKTTSAVQTFKLADASTPKATSAVTGTENTVQSVKQAAVSNSNNTPEK